MKPLVLILLAFSSLVSTEVRCQTVDTSLKKQVVLLPQDLPYKVMNGDTTVLADLDQVMVMGQRVFKNYDDAVRYYTLERNVKIVYPYAIMAEATFAQCQEAIKTMTDESEKKKYVKTVEKQLMKQYSDEMKNLTVTQGRLLIKLINRQTGETSYDIVKELRGSFNAFLWQTVACIFGNSLKSTYDADGEDKDIENIISMIEVGAI